jgi:hypothetical protein
MSYLTTPTRTCPYSINAVTHRSTGRQNVNATAVAAMIKVNLSLSAGDTVQFR